MARTARRLFWYNLRSVIYALRKLIAFVFLGGMFWFIYQDLDNLDKPWFMHALGLIVISFAFFWLLIPMVVVWFRIRRRVKQNRARHAEWLAAGGVARICERHARNARLAVDPGETAWFHEKGTLYIDCASAEFSSAASLDRPVGRPSDVAFPGWRRDCRVVQRTHCYFTNRRVAFAGKDIDVSIPFHELKSASVTPGGMVFEALRGSSVAKFAFTFRNPLISADVLRFAREGR